MFGFSSRKSKPALATGAPGEALRNQPGTWPITKPNSEERSRAMGQWPKVAHYEESKNTSPISQTQYGRDYYPNAPKPDPNGVGAAFAALTAKYKALDDASDEAEKAYRKHIASAVKGERRDVVARNPAAYARNEQGRYHPLAFHATAAKLALDAVQLAGLANEKRSLMARNYPGYEKSLASMKGHKTRADGLLSRKQRMTNRYAFHTALSQGRQPT